MGEKNSINFSISTVLLIISIIVIVIMGYFLYTLSQKNKSSENEVNSLNSRVSNLESSIQNYQERFDSISNTLNSSNTTNNSKEKDNTNTSTSISKSSDETIIKDLFLTKLKELNNSNSEKLLDYRVDKVEILPKSAYLSYTEMGYLSTDVLATVTYSVKPKNVNSSAWIAGDGEIDSGWITKKTSCECLRNGKLVNTNGFDTSF